MMVELTSKRIYLIVPLRATRDQQSFRNILFSSDVFGPFPPFPEDAMISSHFQNEATLTLLQWGVFLDIKNIPEPADSGEER